MSIGKLRSKVSVGYMEECLLVDTPKLVPADRFSNLLVTADCGSTQTRVSVIDLDAGDFESGLNDIFVIPSRYGEPTDFVMSESIKSPLLLDNMQSKIANTASSPDSLVSYHHIARTTIMEDLGLVPRKMTSIKEKSEDPSLVINLVDAIGYALLKKFGGAVPKVNNIVLSLALPPEDLNVQNKERLRENLQSYKWSTGHDLGVDFVFNEIIFTPEAEAFIQGYYALNDNELPAVSLHIEGGGRSISPALCRSGRAVNTARISLPYGGSMLRRIISDEFYAEEQIHLSEKQLDSAVETGKCLVGKKEYNLVPYLISAKEKMAKKIVADLVAKVFENLDGLQITDVEEVTASGRLFAPGEYNMSLMEFVTNELKKFAPNAEFSLINEPYINKGLVLIGLQGIAE